jgi:pilus assembly protein CpaC
MRDRAGRTGSMTRRLRGCWPVVLFLGATLLVASPISGQQFITVPQGSVSLAKGTSVVLVNPAALSRVSIADPNVAEAVVVSPTEVLINGKNLGTTTFVAWDSAGGRHIYGVEVTADAPALKRALTTLFPNEPIEVSASGNTLTLSGRVSSAYVAKQALELAKGSGAVVIDNLATPAPSQILLHVRFAEVSRKAIENLGNQVIDVLNPQDANTNGDWRGSTDSQGTVELSLINSRSSLHALIKALTQTGDFKSLAEPTLLALDGHEASFLAGGEFPFPAVQGGSQNNNAVTIQWRPFGVKLNFTPTVTNIGNIRLDIAPEVSSLDFSQGVTIAGYQMPTILSRRAQTEVELRQGQSLAIAGLLDHSIQKTLQKIPLIGDIPILGALFRTTSNTQQVNELIVIVTPEIIQPSDHALPVPTGEPGTWDWQHGMKPLRPDTIAGSGGR